MNGWEIWIGNDDVVPEDLKSRGDGSGGGVSKPVRGSGGAPRLPFGGQFGKHVDGGHPDELPGGAPTQSIPGSELQVLGIGFHVTSVDLSTEPAPLTMMLSFAQMGPATVNVDPPPTVRLPGILNSVQTTQAG